MCVCACIDVCVSISLCLCVKFRDSRKKQELLVNIPDFVSIYLSNNPTIQPITFPQKSILSLEPQTSQPIIMLRIGRLRHFSWPIAGGGGLAANVLIG